MSRLSTITSNPMIRQFAQGAAQSMTSSVAEFIAPTVEVPTSVGQYKSYTEKNRFHIPDTKRGIGGKAARLVFEASDATYNCSPHALDYPVDYLEQIEAAGLENMVREGAVAVSEVAALSHEQRVIADALTAAGAGTDSNFASSSVDPIDVIDAKIEDVLKASKSGSFMQVKIVMGVTAHRRLKNNALVRGRIYSGAKNPDRPITDDQLSSLFLGQPQIKTSLLVEDTAPEGVTESLSFLLSNIILVFASSITPTRRDPSFMKTFRLMGQWMVPRSYQSEDQRQDVVGFDWSEDVKVTNSSAVARVNANNS